MLPLLWQYHLNIEINDTDNHHCAQSTLLGQLDFSLYCQRDKNRLLMIQQGTFINVTNQPWPCYTIYELFQTKVG